MKVFTFFVISFLLVSGLCLSQTDNSQVKITRNEFFPKASKYNTWEVGVHGGLIYSNTDLAASDLNAKDYKSQGGYGLIVNKFFSHNFALQGQLIKGKLSGIDEK